VEGSTFCTGPPGVECTGPYNACPIMLAQILSAITSYIGELQVGSKGAKNLGNLMITSKLSHAPNRETKNHNQIHNFFKSV